ncbi:hypothetical protein CAPTEDRAFT_204986 [Capitella teleta]|uniref:Uncharacterized protein n=1 Tax=Capitella teleta TaxID=283909 RepID=R7UR02_CAPTE|nr:hypothetical protein CAPTEDRAFT_204986 [Capitella teleta]|eukprot:ELU06367.1 hypothetical protein CAPTEDRAFT_204986 [Capitella teleta]
MASTNSNLPHDIRRLYMGSQGDEEICNMFHSKYEELYNSAPYDHREMNDVTQEIDDLIDTKCNSGQCYYDHMVRARDVLKVVGNGASVQNVRNFCHDLYHRTNVLMSRFRFLQLSNLEQFIIY